jgi:hypothetical protein
MRHVVSLTGREGFNGGLGLVVHDIKFQASTRFPSHMTIIGETIWHIF